MLDYPALRGYADSVAKAKWKERIERERRKYDVPDTAVVLPDLSKCNFDFTMPQAKTLEKSRIGRELTKKSMETFRSGIVNALREVGKDVAWHRDKLVEALEAKDGHGLDDRPHQRWAHDWLLRLELENDRMLEQDDDGRKDKHAHLHIYGQQAIDGLNSNVLQFIWQNKRFPDESEMEKLAGPKPKVVDVEAEAVKDQPDERHSEVQGGEV